MATDVKPTCVVVNVKDADTYRGKQGFDYFPGISATTAGARGLCLSIGTIPPGSSAPAHLHEGHESALYILSGASEMWHGEKLEQHLVVRAGEFLYIPAGMPHKPANLSQSEPCVAIFARTDPNDQESVVLRPDLDALLAQSA
jgi:uncharacterized RmlC-like cupin family protein